MHASDQLDVYTLGIVGMAVGVVISLSFTLSGIVLRGMPALRLWAASFWLLSLAGLAQGYDENGGFLSVIIGSLLIALGNGAMLMGIAVHLGHRLALRWPLALITFYLAIQFVFYLWPPSQGVEATVFGVKSVLWDLWMIWLLLRLSPPELRVSCAFTALILSIDILFYLARAGASVYPGMDSHVVLATALTTSNYLFGILCTFLLGTGFSLMLAQRITHDLRCAADTDGLTGLLNRAAMFTEAGRVVAECHARGESVAVLMFDLDNFKAINDQWGHAAGDRVLRHFVEVIRAAGIKGGALFSRYGGEEFLLLLPATKADEALMVAESMRSRVAAEPAPFDCHVIAFTTSVGVATSPSPELTTMVEAADAALYRAKHAGRNRVALA
ncbi:diguanylate cyclase (GGDEF)-like protein [Luteibacter sp. Sphag1AF]|uniref:GGDEF domain-containing protein n=1 Tax=Luteibacter sp. Sphag1AF TaxID=2587031 RepID=UPI001609D8BA|nr:GGDEF domain-containing protein [Luteibacter sp. Sphag1AF]MBB3228275.1 diguanylate cyclase (GGDEF)-like protein [Luteibacter sp. Sphag1AF]